MTRKRHGKRQQASTRVGIALCVHLSGGVGDLSARSTLGSARFASFLWLMGIMEWRTTGSALPDGDCGGASALSY